MKTIVVPVDFTKRLWPSIQAAVHLASSTRARVIFLNNIFTEKKWEKLPLSKQMEDIETFKNVANGKKKMKELLSQPLVKNVRASEVITYGVAYEEIVSFARRVNADLILMASHSNEGLEKPFIGSTIQKVLREAVCPVLMIKQEFHRKKSMKVAIATDFGKDVQRAFDRAKNIISDLKLQPYLVFINRPTDFMDTRAANKAMGHFTLKYPNIKFRRVIYNHTDVAEGLMEFAEDNHMDWVVLITHNRKHKPKYVIGNTEIVAARSPRPVLSVNIIPEPYPI